MNIPPKKRTSVARKVHMPSVEASDCWAISSNCSAKGTLGSDMLGLRFFFFYLLSVMVRPARYHRNFVKIMLGRRRRRLPLKTGGVPRICWLFLSIFQRPKQINDRQQVADSQDRSA